VPPARTARHRLTHPDRRGTALIVTLTPNPSLDRTIAVESLRRGEVHRASSSRLDPGGKGVNVSRVLAAHGVSTVAVVPTGGAAGAQLAELLAPSGLSLVTVPLASPTRSNVTLVEPDGLTTKINELGPTLSPAETRAMADRLAAVAPAADWVVLSGSLPRGVSDRFYAELVARIHALGRRVAVDSSGAPLVAAVEAKPHLIKPNAEELAELTGSSLVTWGDVAKQAQAVRDGGVEAVLVSLGRDGALLVDADGTRRASTEPVDVRSTVGAGDATLAGFLVAGARGDAALRTAVAFGAAAVSLPGSQMPGPADVHLDLATVEDDPDLSTPLARDRR
jgi:1-phosphofructokinase